MKKTFETTHIKHNDNDFITDILLFLKNKKLDFFKIVNENFEYIILTQNDESKIYEYYLKYLNLSFIFIKENLNYKKNESFFTEDFLSVFFGLRGTYSDGKQYVLWTYKYSYFDEDIFCNFFFEFLSKKIIDLLEFYNFPKVLSFVYRKREGRKGGIEFRANLRFLNDNVIYFKNSKFKKVSMSMISNIF